MGLFDRNRKKDIEILNNAVNVNELNEQFYFKPFCWDFKKKGRFDFAAFFLQLITNRIYSGLQNVTWQTTEISYLGMDVTNFIDRNEQLLMWSYWSTGYAVAIVEDSGVIRLPKRNEIRLDSNGYVVNKNAVVVYSNPYVTQRTTHFKLIQPILKNINANLNNSNYVSENLGALGILSSKAVPLSPAGKEELNTKLQKDYGLGEEQFRFILTNQEMAYTPIDLPIKELDFNGKVKDDINWLCNFFGISPDMVFGQSTYNNSAEATKAFYRTCITPIAETLLQLGRTIFIYMDTELKPSSVLTYRITNIPELNTALSSESEEQMKYLDLLQKLNETGYVDTEALVQKVYEHAKKMISEV